MRNLGFVSTRFAGTDGVSLESEKWATVLERLGYSCFYFAGESNRPPEVTYLVPEASFHHPDIVQINEIAFGQRVRPPALTEAISRLKQHLKMHLQRFISRFGIEALVVENALTIPLNLPLGLALCELIAETGIPTLAHHHDFFWERTRFMVNCVWDYLNQAFPPNLPFIRHVVINSSAAHQLAHRTGIASVLIPNVMDFESPPPSDLNGYAKYLKKDLEIAEGEYFFLQPTRVVQRKGIEHAVELIHRLGLKARLIISHASGDEGHEYEQHIRWLAKALQVPVNFVSDIIREQRGQTPDGRRIYALWDVYPQADLVTYPSTFEGFGNAFLEAVYFRRPIVVNNYSIYAFDIKPKGFRTIEFDGFITADTVKQVQQVLTQPGLAEEMVEQNYRLGLRFYSFSVLEHRLRDILLSWSV
ncbi:glycosyltransferase family 4 protein [uncultured Thermanaerothrix sp.]|uniref:glycosyltransferase family 4 protein n=1 Tax=uncultured Thermanaerothrix sp. TaxID=1195149 RepID=UPI002633C9BF|nr:glycosyltransferase family 4 protein [uncultured Thermanaerothrix sp.]